MSTLAEVRAALDQEWSAFMVEKNPQGKLTQAENWRRSNPGEWYLLSQYRAGGARPAMATSTGRQMVEHVDAWLLTASTPPPSGHGTKLPAWFHTVYKQAPTTSETISGTHGDITLSSSSPKRFVFAQGATANSVRLEVLKGCVVDFGWAKIRNGLDGIKAVGCSDILVRRFDIAGVRNQGILAVDCSRYVFAHGKIGPNNPDQSLPGWRDHAHGIYLASSPDGVLGNILGTGQRTGYSVQVYPNTPRVTATGCDLNNPNDLGSSYSGSAFVWGEGGFDGLIVNTIARECRFQMVYGGAGAPVPAVRVLTSAEVNRRGWYPDGQPGAVVGEPNSSPDSVGEAGYRLPDDPRSSGLGTFGIGTL